MRRLALPGATKTVANLVAQTISVLPNEFQYSKLINIFVNFGGGTNFADITRIRLKRNGVPFIDLSALDFRARVEALSEGDIVISAAATNFPIPAGLLRPHGYENARKYDWREMVQFPDAPLTLEIVLAATAVAGTMDIGVEYTDTPAFLHPWALGYPINATGAISNFPFQISVPGGVLRAVTIPRTNLSRLKIVLENEEVLEGSGPTFSGGTTRTTLDAYQKRYAPSSIVTPYVLPVNGGKLPVPGQSYMQLDVAAGWLATNEVVFDLLAPASPEAAAALIAGDY